jgi:hypothetical protein
MMELLGLRKDETHLFPFAQKVLMERLERQVEKPSRKNARKPVTIAFNGIISRETFTISRNFSYPQYFVPMIHGRFVEGEKETLLYLKYELFRGSKLFLALWSVVCTIAYFYCGLVMKKWDYSAVALVILLINYLVVLANFSLHCKQSRLILLNILNN